MSMSSDFFSSRVGQRRRRSWRSRELGKLTDTVFDWRLAGHAAGERLRERERALPRQRVLLTGVEVPARKADLHAVIDQMVRETAHEVSVVVAPMQSKGKFQNIQDAIQSVDLTSFDYLLVIDDDVVQPAGFLDRMIFLSQVADLKISQPAHRFRSYVSYDLTLRAMDSLVRRTHFVECGPVTMFHRDVFPLVLPFHDLRWAWGLDVWWAEMARRDSFAIGIVDAAPLEHTRPVAATYDYTKAIDEAEQFFSERQITRTRQEILQTISTVRTLPERF